MTIATFLLILIGQRVTLTHRLLMRENLMLDQFGNLVRLTVAIVLVATAIQFFGFTVLFTYFYLFLYPMGEAVWQAAFHAVSAFNNAGFVAFNHPSGLRIFQTDKFVIGVLGTLIFVGGISYLVVIDLIRARRFARFSLNTKLVIVGTISLLLLGFAAIFVLEYNNPSTLGELSALDKVAVSMFQSISDRTAGFGIVDISKAHDGTNVLQMALMFIGGASASVAGGVKVNTMAVVVVALVAQIRQRNSASVFGRELPNRQVQRAYLILSIAVAFVFLVVMLLSITEDGADTLAVIFEVISAFGTCGLEPWNHHSAVANRATYNHSDYVRWQARPPVDRHHDVARIRGRPVPLRTRKSYNRLTPKSILKVNEYEEADCCYRTWALRV